MDIIKDLESSALESGRENQKETFILSKWKEYIPGIVDTQKNTISCEILQYNEWIKVIKERWEKNIIHATEGLTVIFRYPDAIIGKPGKDQILEEVDGTSLIVRFK